MWGGSFLRIRGLRKNGLEVVSAVKCENEREKTLGELERTRLGV